MQLYALDIEDRLVFVDQATKQTDYFCRECRGTIRLRSGLHRHRHFYHLQPTRTCSSSGKSLTHLQVQYRLFGLLPAGECQLEYQMPTINRIADVVWLSRQVVFEIQCSGISATEIRQRNADYAVAGFYVIWILHDNCFNQRRLSAAEDVLKKHAHYFTNIDDTGMGLIYDQFSLISKGMRQATLGALPIDVSHLQSLSAALANEPKDVPPIIAMRQAHWPFYCRGDLVDCYNNRKQSEYFIKIAQLVQPTQIEVVKYHWWHKIAHFYRLILQMLLEKACR